MKRLKFFLLFPYVILCTGCFGQSGSIHFHFDISLTQYQDSYHCFLYSNDSIVKVKTIETFEDWTVDSLAKGSYRLEVTGVDGKNIFSDSDIIVKNDSITHEDIMLGRDLLSKKRPDYTQPFEVNISCLYGNNQYFEGQHINSKNQTTVLKFGWLGKGPVSKFDQICFYIGGSGSGTVFDKDTSTYKGLPVQRKWYSGFCLDLGLYNRFTFYDNKKKANAGFFIDAGISYSLPLYYKEVKVLDRQTKIKTKFIHEYTDVYLLTRVGFKFVALTAEYNLSTFLKSSYTEVPTARIGLAFCIPTIN
jgi:hypothetical protein